MRICVSGCFEGWESWESPCAIAVKSGSRSLLSKLFSKHPANAPSDEGSLLVHPNDRIHFEIRRGLP